MKRRLLLNLDDRRPVWSMPEWVAGRIREALPAEWELVRPTDPSDGTGDGAAALPEVLKLIRGAEIYMGYGFPEALLAAAGDNLRWVHSGAAGVAASLHPAMRASPVVLTNSAGIHAEPIADYVLAATLHFTRGLDLALAAQREARWAKEPFIAAETPLREISELRVGIHGLGGIGRAIARRFLALGARVAATRRRGGEAPDGIELLTGPDALDRLLAGSDVVAVTVPRTPATEGTIGPERLDRMRAGGILVVVSRGGVVDEAALAERLADGRIRGAALDVFATEPLQPESPLWTLPNALVTPHVSGVSHHFWRRQAELILANLERYLAGSPLINTVDKQAGY